MNARKVHENEKFLSALLEASNDPIYLVSPQRTILSWNPSAQRLFGYGPDEAIGHDVFLIVPEDKRDEFARRFDEALAGGRISNLNSNRLTKQGGQVPVALNFSAIRDDSGKISSVLIIAHDRSEAQRISILQETFKDERDLLLDRLHLYLEKLPIAFVLTDSHFNYTYWNPAAESLFGYSFREVEGKKDLLIGPAGMEKLGAEMKGTLAAGGDFRGKVAAGRRKDGTRIACEWYMTPLKDESGAFMGVLSMALDITSRVESARALAESEERFRRIFDESPVGLKLMGDGARILMSNRVLASFLGYSQEDLNGRSLHEICCPEDVKKDADLFEQLMVGDIDRYEIEKRFRRKDGLVVWGRLRMASIRSKDGLPLYALGMVEDITEARKAEETKNRLVLILEQTSDGVIVLDLEGKIVEWNHGAELLYGYSAREVVGKTPFFLPEGAHEKNVEMLRKELAQGKGQFHYEAQRKRKDGRLIDIDVTYSILRDREGGIGGYSVIVRDITERKRSEETQRRLASILEQTQDGVIVFDMQGIVLDWNNGAEKIYGYKAGEIIGKSKSILEPPELQGEIGSHQKKILETQQPMRYESIRLRKDGQLIHVASTLGLVRDEAGHVTGFSAITRDITERKKAEEVRAQLAAILQQTSDAVVGTDLEGNIFSWNRGAEHLFGYSLDEVLGMRASQLAPEDRKHEALELRAIVQAGENISNFETVRVRKDAQAFDVSISMSPIRDTRGKMIGVSSIHRDITERKKAEESLRQHEEQLRQIEKMNAIGRLAGGVAHDFNNLLSVIGGNAEFLKASLDPKSPSQDEVMEIQKAVQRGSDLAKQLLVFGQRQVSQPQPVNLNEVSVDMKKMFKRLMDAHVELAIIQDPSIKPVLADPGQIQQIILNLVINARDAMPQGGTLILETKEITVDKLDHEDRPTLPVGDYVRFAVTDTGMGMSPEVQRHIFEPFFTTKQGKGTGLGLATVYTLVRKWSGHIFVHSSPGIGTTFTLYFPAMISVEGFEQKPKQESLIPVGSETILLAEDEEQLRKVLVRSLERYGYKVLPAANGLEAVKVAWDYKDNIDLLLTDTIMPKMNGKELMVELKKNRPKIKVIFISGYPKEVLSQQGILESGIHLVQKPFELEDLVQQVRGVLDEKK